LQNKCSVGWLFIALRPAQEYFTLYMETSPLPVKGAGMDLYRATPAVIQDLGFACSSEGPLHSVASYDTQGDVENLFLP
jgi:hypothetical protein